MVLSVLLVRRLCSTRRFHRSYGYSDGIYTNVNNFTDQCCHQMMLLAQYRGEPSRSSSRTGSTSTISSGSIGITEDNRARTKRQEKEQQQQQQPKQAPVLVPIQKRLDVAVIGLPNAGKSQLLNVLCQSKVSAVSRKRHTTRQGILGIRSIGDTQLIFTDTPGFMKHDEAVAEQTPGSISITKKILHRLTKQAKQGVADSDISLLVIDAARTMTDSVRETLASLMFYACLTHVQQHRKLLQQQPNNNNSNNINNNNKLLPLTTTVPLIIVLNKVDLVKPKTKLLQLAYEMCLMANTCWEKAEKFDMDDLEDIHGDDGKDNPAQGGKVILAMDGENINHLLPKDHMELITSRSDTNNGTTRTKEEEKHPPQQREICPVFMVSALQDDGVQDMVQYLVNEAMPGDWVDTEENTTTTSTDMSPQEHASEIIREKIYRTVHQEVPYHVYQRTRRFEYVSAAAAASATNSTRTSDNNNNINNNNNNMNQNKILCIEQDFIVPTKSHKRLLEGKNGTILKRISDQAKRDLQELFHCYVSLTLRVKIKRTNNSSQLQQLSADDDDIGDD